MLNHVMTYVRFARALFADPRSVGAVAPSGAALISLMTRSVDASTGAVVELGAGTGAFTRALIRRGVRESDLTIVESNEELAKILRTDFPKATFLREAEVLGQVAASSNVGAVISGLPLLNMSPSKVHTILAAAFGNLKPGANLFQFTYGCHCPIPAEIMECLGLRAEFVGGTFLNLPPASVYRISRVH